MAIAPVFPLGKSHGQRSLGIYSPWGHKEVDMTEHTCLGYIWQCCSPSLSHRLLPLPVDFPGGSDSKASAYNVGDLGSTPGSERSPGEGNGNPLQYFCLEKSHGQRNLVGYSPWGHKELDMTEQLHFPSSIMGASPFSTSVSYIVLLYIYFIDIYM